MDKCTLTALYRCHSQIDPQGTLWWKMVESGIAVVFHFSFDGGFGWFFTLSGVDDVVLR